MKRKDTRARHRRPFSWLVPLLLLLTACEAATGPDPRDEFSQRNVGKTREFEMKLKTILIGAVSAAALSGGGLESGGTDGQDLDLQKMCNFSIMVLGFLLTLLELINHQKTLTSP